MARRASERPSVKAVIEYQNTDAVKPAYVEGAQGMRTSKGALHVSFYSEYLQHSKELSGQVTESREGNVTTVSIAAPDPFGSDQGKVHIVRRIEANLIFTIPALQSIVPWLQQKLDELTKQELADGLEEQRH